MTQERFSSFDLSQGLPFRELVGCLLWVTLCVMGPELLRVKDLARRSNSFTETNYQDGLKVLQRVYERREHGIVIYRHAAGKELVPSSSRTPIPLVADVVMDDEIGAPILTGGNELTQRSLCWLVLLQMILLILSMMSTDWIFPEALSRSIPIILWLFSEMPRLQLAISNRA
jgi:hypothetical protein